MHARNCDNSLEYITQTSMSNNKVHLFLPGSSNNASVQPADQVQVDMVELLITFQGVFKDDITTGYHNSFKC